MFNAQGLGPKRCGSFARRLRHRGTRVLRVRVRALFLSTRKRPASPPRNACQQALELTIPTRCKRPSRQGANPEDLRKLPDTDLRQVADELRAELLMRSRSPAAIWRGLGVVELTVALIMSSTRRATG